MLIIRSFVKVPQRGNGKECASNVVVEGSAAMLGVIAAHNEEMSVVYLTQFEAYLLTHKRVSPHTLSAYRSDLRQLQEFLDDEKIVLEKITEDILKKYLYFLKHERHLDAR